MPARLQRGALIACAAVCVAAAALPSAYAFGFTPSFARPRAGDLLQRPSAAARGLSAAPGASLGPVLGNVFGGAGVPAMRGPRAAAGRAAWASGLSMTGTTNIRGDLTFHPRVTVLGGGNFGLALASILGNNNIPVTVLVRRQEIADALNNDHKHPSYLNGLELPPTVSATIDPTDAFKEAAFVVHSVPVQYSRDYLKNIAPHLPKDIPIICTSKGIETGTLCLMRDILEQETGTDREFAFLSGPSFAKELVQGLVTAVTVASESEKLANEVVELFGSETFRVFTSKDVTGVEIGGAVKNVIAIAAGMSEGLGLGTNAMSALVTRGCLEMMAVAKAYGSKKSTLTGLAGVGDTFGTCFGPLSRNRQLGFRLGQGEKLEDILASSTEVAEGYATSLSLVEFIDKKLPESFRKDLKFPILFGVADILKGNSTPEEGLKALMTMPLRTEIFDEW